MATKSSALFLKNAMLSLKIATYQKGGSLYWTFMILGSDCYKRINIIQINTTPSFWKIFCIQDLAHQNSQKQLLVLKKLQLPREGCLASLLSYRKMIRETG